MIQSNLKLDDVFIFRINSEQKARALKLLNDRELSSYLRECIAEKIARLETTDPKQSVAN